MLGAAFNERAKATSRYPRLASRTVRLTSVADGRFDNCQIDIVDAPTSATQGAQPEYTLGAWTERLALSWKP